MAKRTALLIGNQTFHADSLLPPLRGPLNDIAQMQRLLGDPERGQFEVQTFADQTSRDVSAAINEVLNDGTPADLVVIHYSGHGKLDRSGKLCLATADTRAKALYATSIPVSHLHDMINNSDCGSVILLLDCCYSGVATNIKGVVEDELRSLKEASGLFILAASSEVQSANEVESESNGLVMGRFTASIVAGIESGAADEDQDGCISITDVVRYVKSTVRTQTPQWFAANAKGDPRIAFNPIKGSFIYNPQMIPKLVSDNWQQRLEAISYFTELGRSSPAAAIHVQEILQTHFQQTQATRPRRQVYDSSNDIIPFTSWTSFCQGKSPGTPIQLGPKRIAGLCCYEVRSFSSERLGINKVIENSRGSIYFRYRILQSTSDNVQFHVIPMRYSDATWAGRRRHGDEVFGRTASGSERSLRVVSMASSSRTDWIEDELDFDFHELGSDVFAMFTLRVNQRCERTGPAHALLGNVRVLTV